MKRVTGIGGIFFKCRDREAMLAWYQKHLGIPMEPWGAQFFWGDTPEGAAKPYSVLGLFKEQTDYFDPSTQPFMINFRVDNLTALLAQLRTEGVTIVGTPLEEDYGKFAWVLDPEGNKIELWEQTA
ncbi:MAG: VOC family protein [Saprospiraceae bacterium]